MNSTILNMIILEDIKKIPKVNTLTITCSFIYIYKTT